MLTIWIGK